MTVSEKPYRVEVSCPKDAKERYYFVKDVRVGDKKGKVRKYLCSEKVPTYGELEDYRKRFGPELERKAAKKAGELGVLKYNTEFLTTDLLSKLEELKYLYKQFNTLLTVNEQTAYEEKFEVCYIQGTTSIEGNTFTREETHELLYHGVVPSSKSLREVNEIQNFKKVKTYRDTYRGKVTIEFIKNLHSLIVQNIDDESAGMFRRTDDIGIIGCDLQVTPSLIIEDELQRIIDYYYQRSEENYHPFEEAAMFHYFFEMIHPFADGNGRVGREIFNYMLTRSHYPKMLFLGDDRSLYLDGLKRANEDNYSDLVALFANLIISQRMDILLKNLENLIGKRPQGSQRRLNDFFSI